MREIKFRAYDTYTKMMLPIVDIIKFTKSESLNITREGAYGVGINIPYQPSIKIMQYTGLKDRNGKEIYEKDIVKRLDSKPNYIVYYSGGAFRLAPTYDCETLLEYEKNGYRYENSLYRRQSSSFRKNTTEEFEVIGNIYDNPELLHN